MFKKIIIALAPLIAFGIIYLLITIDIDDIIPKSKIKNTEFCYGDTCKNTCNKINATKAKPGGSMDSQKEAIEENENNKFKAENCDKGTKLLANTFSKCGGSGDVECQSDDCCEYKTCGSDFLSSDEDIKQYLLDKNIIYEQDINASLSDIYDNHQNAQYILSKKKMIDGNCPFQKTLKNRDHKCTGKTRGVSGDCDENECCEDKTCGKNWYNNDDTLWDDPKNSNPTNYCPSQGGGDQDSPFLKLEANEPCDMCDMSECCYRQSNYCIVPNNSNSLAIENTNIKSVKLNVGNYTGNLDLTSDNTLLKADIMNNASGIQQVIRNQIKCNAGLKYGMCNGNDDYDDDDCKNHDNNRRNCENAGCNFNLSDNPRIDFTGCSEKSNTIQVYNCINTCTADNTVKDENDNYFFSNAESSKKEAVLDIDSKYNFNFHSQDDDYYQSDYSLWEPSLQPTCNSETFAGRPEFEYNCSGGGDYFSVSNLDNCTSTCGELYSNGAGRKCPDGTVYNNASANDEAQPTFDEACCITATCSNISDGNEQGCSTYKKLKKDPLSDGTIPNADNCCEPMTCSDYLNDFESLRQKLNPTEPQLTEDNICNPGYNFEPDKVLGSEYLSGGMGDDSENTTYGKYTQYRGFNGSYSPCCFQYQCDTALTKGLVTNNCPGGREFSDTNIYTGGYSCCVDPTETILCKPETRLNNEKTNNYPGYIINDNQFKDREFTLNDGSYNLDITDNSVNCSGSGTPQLQCYLNPNPNGDNFYTLTGCPEPNPPDIGQVCSDGNQLDIQQFCTIPPEFTNHNLDFDILSGIDTNNNIFMDHFSHELESIKCRDSTQLPCMSACSPSYTKFSLTGCNYRNNFVTDGGDNLFFTDYYKTGMDVNGSFTYAKCSYQNNASTWAQDHSEEIKNTNVKHFSCHCLGDPSDQNCERAVRFKYVFNEDPDFIHDNTLITNASAIAIAINDPSIDYQLSEILDKGKSICQPGYYPYRGTKYDYCEPCTNSFSEEHPMVGVIDEFCKNGILSVDDSDSDKITGLINAPSINASYYDNKYYTTLGSVIGSTMNLDSSGTETNIDYNSYAQLTNDGNKYPNFQSAENFTFGTRVCSDPNCRTGTINTELLDFSKIEDSDSDTDEEENYFIKAKKWWNKYLFDDSEGFINSLQSKINSSTTEDQLKNKDNYDNDITNITDINASHYLYRDVLQIKYDESSDYNQLPTVCNNYAGDKDFIPTGFANGSITGTCELCVNEMGDVATRSDMPEYSQGEPIVRNISEEYYPICSFEAGMYESDYNQGNIVDFRRKIIGGNVDSVAETEDDQQSSTEGEQGPCKAGFIYYKEGIPKNTNPGLETESDSEVIKYIRCLPKNPKLVQFCDLLSDNKDDCNQSYTFNPEKDIKNTSGDSIFDHYHSEIDESSGIYELLSQDYKIADKSMGVYCGYNDQEQKCKPIYKINGGYLTNTYESLYNSSGIFITESTTKPAPPPGVCNEESRSAFDCPDTYFNSSIDVSNYYYSHPNQSVLGILDKHITNYMDAGSLNYTNLIDNSSPLSFNTGSDPIDTDTINDISQYMPDPHESKLDLTNLSAANQIQKGINIYDPNLDYKSYDSLPDFKWYAGSLPPDSRYYDIYEKPFQSETLGIPTRINPVFTKLNDDQVNRCNKILYEGPLDFFYDPYGNNNYTISSSCYLRSNASRRNSDNLILTENSTSYNIKSTPLYYGKGRNYLGGTLTKYSSTERLNDPNNDNYNILNPNITQNGPNGLKYAKRSLIEEDFHDTGYADAALFPMMERVKGCHNNSLIYNSGSSDPGKSPLNIGGDINTDNEREQCIFTFDNKDNKGINNCINSCLNNNECDVVKMSIDKPVDDNLTCELIKWVRLPDSINVTETELLPNGDNNKTELTGDEAITALKSVYLGGHLINADPKYDESTYEGVNNWYKKITGLELLSEDGWAQTFRDYQYDPTAPIRCGSRLLYVQDGTDQECDHHTEHGEKYSSINDYLVNQKSLYYAREINKQIDLDTETFRTDYNNEKDSYVQPDWWKDTNINIIIPPPNIDLDTWRENRVFASNAPSKYNIVGRNLWVDPIVDKKYSAEMAGAVQGKMNEWVDGRGLTDEFKKSAAVEYVKNDLKLDQKDDEIWYSMNKIRKNTDNTNTDNTIIENILNRVNNATMTNLIGDFTRLAGDTWRKTFDSITTSDTINEDSIYQTNDSVLSSSTVKKNKKIFNMVPVLPTGDEKCAKYQERFDEVKKACPPKPATYGNANLYVPRCNDECSLILPKFLDDCTIYSTRDEPGTPSSQRPSYRNNNPGDYYFQLATREHTGCRAVQSSLMQGSFKECPEGTYVDTDNKSGNLYCAQVLNECASCKDISDYLINKGAVEENGKPSPGLMWSYGCQPNYDGHSWKFISPNEYPNKIKAPYTTGYATAVNTGSKILSSLQSFYKYDDSRALFLNQHNLTAKAPDGTIIDAEKCICPDNLTVKVRRQGAESARPIGICQ